MAKAIIARNEGDDYQARWFWLLACGLLDECSRIERVVHEDEKLRAFDDVAVYYRAGHCDKTGAPLDAEFYQVKFHVTSAGALTGDALCDPAFISAKTTSLLQRIKDAHEHCTAKGIVYRLILKTPWTVHPDDPLADVHSQKDGNICWEKLAQGGERSALGHLRRKWREHLQLRDDEQLREILSNVRLEQGPTLDELGRNLNWRLKANGLRPVLDESLGHTYDELTRKMLQENLNELNAASMRDLCRREGLIIEPPKTDARVSIGIRSFLRWAEDLGNQTQSLLCLCERFEGRHIRDPQDWSSRVFTGLASFLSEHLTRGGAYRLHLDAHSTIAFAAGYLLPEKMGIAVDVVQHSGCGTSDWRYGNEQNDHSQNWIISCEDLGGPNAEDIALGIGLTHDIRNDVMEYVRSALPSTGRLIVAMPTQGPSSSLVRDGGHAETLANGLIHHLRAQAAGSNPIPHLHLFLAAPNGFTFCLGRKMQPFPNWTFYEHDFGSGKTGAYSPSITNPNRRGTHASTSVILQ